MGTKINSNYSDLLTFTRASKGHALRPVSYGTEIIQNGTYDSDLTGWDDDSIGSGTATVSSGQVSLTRVDASNRGGISQSHTLVSGKIYLLSFELVSGAVQAKYKGGSGSASQYFNNEDWNQLTTAGIYQTRFVATGTDGDIVFLAINNGVTAVLDNVSVKEVTFDQPDGTLTLFEHPVNVPRVEWDSAGNRLGLLVEEARTNLVTYSEAFDNAAWAKNSTSVTANDIQSPDKQDNGYKVQSTSGGAASNVNETVSKTANTDYTFSVFVKKGNVDRVVVGQQITGAYSNNIYDFSTDTWTTTGSGSPTLKSESVGNGWYRLSVTMDAGATTGNYQNWVGPLDSDATSHLDTTSGNNVYIFGAQIEAGSFPTSYIKNEGTASGVTRSADVASIPVADFGYNADAGSLLAEAKLLIKDVSYKAVVNLNTNGSNRIRIISSSSVDVIQAEITDGGANQLSLSESITEGASFKAIVAYKENNSSSSVNGSVEAIDTACTIPAVTKLDIMTGMTGHIKSIKYYPRRLTNAQLVELTS